jgi:crossover junction endodeoxyribonuclease RuvC
MSALRVLGIDPGSTVTGFGVVERARGGLVHVEHGTVRPPRGAELAVRLAALHAALGALLARTRPDVAVVERVFVAASPRAALVLGHARGVALAALAGAGVPVRELAPSEVKQAVAGFGGADKRQVQAMVQRLLALDAPPARDAADALAAALCEAQAGRLAALVPAAAAPRARRSLRLVAEAWASRRRP